jgi:hypothetical protein
VQLGLVSQQRVCRRERESEKKEKKAEGKGDESMMTKRAGWEGGREGGREGGEGTYLGMFVEQRSCLLPMRQPPGPWWEDAAWPRLLLLRPALPR